MKRPAPITSNRSALPVRVLGVVLILVFGVELGIMLTLPYWNPFTLGDLGLAIVDATTLTAALTPALWMVVVRPLRDLFEQRGRLLSRVIQVQEHERARISRDLHDDLGQLLTAVLVGLRTIDEAPDFDQARVRARRLSTVASEGLDVVRRIARGLRTGVLQDLGLRLAIERLVEDIALGSGVEMTAQVLLPPSQRFPPPIEMAAYRLVQEAMTNVVRHADATRADVHVTSEDGFSCYRIVKD